MRAPIHATVFACLAVLLACGAEDDGFAPPAELGRLRVVHASPDTAQAQTVNVQIDGVPLAANLAYKNATPYALAAVGDRHVVVRRTSDTSIVVVDTVVTIAAAVTLSVLATGLGTDLGALALTEEDKFYLTGTVRIIHASPSMGTVDVYITSPGADLGAQTPVATALAYRAATANLGLLADTAQVRFTATGTTTELLTGPKLKIGSAQVRSVVALDAPGGGLPYTLATLVDR